MIVLKPETYLSSESRKAILLFHGWTSSPSNVRDVALGYQRLGYNVHVPLLKGHGVDTKEEFIEASYKDWLEQSIHEARKFFDPNLYDEFNVGGHSMGGLLACNVAASKLFDIKNIHLIAPAFVIKNKIAYLSGLISLFFKFFPKNKATAIEYPLDPETDKLNADLFWANTWVEPVYDLVKVAEHVTNNLSRIRCKRISYIIAQDDEAVDQSTTVLVINKLQRNCDSLTINIIPNGGHNFTPPEFKKQAVKLMGRSL